MAKSQANHNSESSDIKNYADLDTGKLLQAWENLASKGGSQKS